MKCFGKFVIGSANCRKCEYLLSCRYYKMTGKKMDAREHIVSFDAAQELCECADFDHIPGNEEPFDFNREIILALSRFFRYMLELDEYSIGIIAEVVSPENKGVHCTVPYLSRIHGCSRQAMHRKILDIIARRPELTSLLKSTMYKLSAGRQLFIRRRSEQAIAENLL